MAYGIGEYTGSNRQAEYKYRDLYRAQYADWKNRFKPYEDELIKAATSTDMLDEQLSRISATTERTKQQSQQSADMNRGRLGLTQNAQQSEASSSRLNLSSGLANINAKNSARQGAYDNYQNVMTGAGAGASGIPVSPETGGATS